MINDNEWKEELIETVIRILGNDHESDERVIEKVGYSYGSYAPEIIYKYYSAKECHIQAISNQKMWYSSPSRFNDPFDSMMKMDEETILDALMNIISDGAVRPGSLIWNDTYRSLKNAVEKVADELSASRIDSGIACFSETEDSLLMWSHYGGNHKGMCVAYRLLDFNELLGFSPVPIIYTE